jgi:hypothetical protein
MVDQDIHSWLNMDDLFSDVVQSLNNNPTTPPTVPTTSTQENHHHPYVTMTLGSTPNPLLSFSERGIATSYVPPPMPAVVTAPVSPSSSTTSSRTAIEMLSQNYNDSCLDILEPTTLAEMALDRAHVSPSPSNASEHSSEAPPPPMPPMPPMPSPRNTVMMAHPHAHAHAHPQFHLQPNMNPKKRNRSIMISNNNNNHNSCSSFENPSQNNNDLDGDRRKRNREHAKRSRQRKKSLTSGLEQSLADLKEENAKLREQVYAKIGQTKAEALVQDRMAKATGAFVTTIKESNRVVEGETLKFLQGLRKELLVAPPAGAQIRLVVA